MTDYGLDRSKLEDLSTEEIQKILKRERDDYTPEAIAIFEEILASRGVAGSCSSQGLGFSGVREAPGKSAGGAIEGFNTKSH